MRSIVLIIMICLGGIVFPTPETSAQEPYQYVSPKKFLSWPHAAQIDYVSGLLDGVAYSNSQDSAAPHISACLRAGDRVSPLTFVALLETKIREDAAAVPPQLYSNAENLMSILRAFCKG